MVIWKQSTTAASSAPAYQQMAHFIKEQISIGNLKNGDRLPPVRKIATESGVGLNTVCHALSLLTQERVINQTRGKGTFVTDDATQRITAHVPQASTLRLDGIRVMILGPLAWLTRGDPRPFESLERQLHALGGTTRFQTEDEFHPLAQKRYDQLPEVADAIVWFDINGLNDPAEDAQKAQRIWALGLPTVTTRSLYNRLFDGVNVNWNQGMWQAVEHLAQRGDKRVAFLGLRNAPESPQRFPWVTARLEMFLTACKYFGLQADESDIWFSQVPQVQVTDHFPDVMRQTGRRLGQKILQSDRQYTAMIGVNDALALGVSDMLTQAGLRIPQDVALIGFDDSTEAMAEGLTSIAPLWENTAKAAAQLLARIIVQPQPDYTHMVLSKPHLILRSSTTGQSREIKRSQTTTQLLDSM